MKLFRKKKDDLTVLQVDQQTFLDEVDPTIINKITCDMFDRTYWNTGIVTINYGFVPVDPHGYHTKFAFDASGLTLYKLYKRVPNGIPNNPLHLVLKGLLRYVITLDQFRPYDLSVIGESSNITSFSVSGFIPVNSVLAVGDIDKYSDTEFTIKLCKKKHYISGMDGKITPFNKFGLFGKLMRNPDVLKNINVPFSVMFLPKVDEIVTTMSDDLENDDQVNINAITPPIVDLTIVNTIPNTFGYQYKEGKALSFQTSIAGHRIEKVVEVENNLLTSEPQYHAYLVGQIQSNTTVNNLYPISATTNATGISFTSSGVVEVNDDLGMVATETELLEVVSTLAEVIVNETNMVAVTESGDIVEYDPNDPEVFYQLFDGVSRNTFEQLSSVVVVPTPVPFS